MRIRHAEIEPIRLALRRPLVTARGTVAVRTGFVLRLGADGQMGEGEASPAYWLGDASLARTEKDLRRVVAAAADAPDAERLRARFLASLGTTPLIAAAASALDSALLDLAARAAGIAAMDLLRTPGPAPRRVVATAALVTGRDASELRTDVDAALAAGFTILKTKVGAGDLADDVRRVAALRRAVGPSVQLRLDANRAWSLDKARRALAALAPYDPAFVEEPLADPDPDALATLARETPVPLALDESLVDGADLERFVASGVRAHVVLKAVRVGGPTRLVALARRAHAADMPVVVTDAIEGQVGMRVALHAAAALPGAALAIGLGGAQLADDAAAHALRRPTLAACGPGFGVDASLGTPVELARA